VWASTAPQALGGGWEGAQPHLAALQQDPAPQALLLQPAPLPADAVVQGGAHTPPQNPAAGRGYGSGGGQARCGAPSPRLFVGNLAPQIAELELAQLFAAFGQVASTKVSGLQGACTASLSLQQRTCLPACLCAREIAGGLAPRRRRLLRRWQPRCPGGE
jgi:hypothetical protein